MAAVRNLDVRQRLGAEKNYTSFRQGCGVLTDTLTLEPSRAGHVSKGRKEVRDEQLFARLIGAAVLLALAVIVLPFVLDGSGSQREYEYAETLPLEPPRPQVERSFSSRQPDATDQSTTDQSNSVTGGLQAPTRESVSVDLPQITSTAGLQAPSVTPASATATTVSLSNQVAAAAASGPAVISPRPASGGAASGSSGADNTNAGNSGAGNSGAINDTPIQPGWNIQVASFVRDANAIKLVNKLRARNLPAYANWVKGQSRTVIRVVVGPYANQIDALALQNRIDREYRVESLMVKR